MAKVTLTIKEGNKKETQQFEIDRMTTIQAIKLKTEVGKVLKELKESGELKNVLESLMNGDLNPEEIDPEDIKAEQLEALKDERFMNGLASAFDNLLETLPDRAFNIISILSGIDSQTLEKTYLDEILDVYDAIIEENDIVKLVDRVKKSFTKTKERWSAIKSQNQQ